MDLGEFRHQVRALERAVLRGVRPSPGLDGILDALDPKDLGPQEIAQHQDLLRRLHRCLAPLIAAMAARTISLRELAAAHVSTAEALAATAEARGADQLWRGEAGEAVAAFLAELLAAAEKFPAVAGVNYPALFESLMAGRVVRPRYGSHPRLAIWGLLEARLQRADLMILGGLNEGSWPSDPADDPWMSRPMRQRFGVAAPERRVGVAAHDLVQAMGAPEVVLTRSVRVEGTPTLPSRWLLRLDAVLCISGHAAALSKDGAVLAWQRLLDEPAAATPIQPPAPCPPVAARPRRLSVTEIETWMRDPYAIYARHVLKLAPLDALDAEPDARDRGIAVHKALDDFVAAYPATLPPDAGTHLLEIGQRAFGALLTRPGIWAFWWPRYERIARWFLEQERARRPALALLASETRGVLEFPVPGGSFTLVGKADRIEGGRDHALTIVDYKTGIPPTRPDVGRGLAPQLPLEAAIANAGGFALVPAAPVAALEYWRLGGLYPAGERKVISEGSETQRLMEEARAGLLALVLSFDDPATPYRARPAPDRAPRYSDYTHLERVKEWRAEPEEE
jgi:ATP-dependent helicase/nuclease subunit B